MNLMRFRYQLKHLDCAYCLDLTNALTCPHELCPHILDNLADLNLDPAFRTAVEDADCCGSFHRPTLIHLQIRLSCQA